MFLYCVLAYSFLGFLGAPLLFVYFQKVSATIFLFFYTEPRRIFWGSLPKSTFIIFSVAFVVPRRYDARGGASFVYKRAVFKPAFLP